MPSHVETPEHEPVILMSRIFDAPRALVWATFTDCKHQKHWWGGPGWTLPSCEIDLRVGGHWRQVMRTPDGAEYPLHSIFLEVVEPEKLVWKSAAASDNPHAPPSPVQTVTFEDLGNGKTKWRLVASFDSDAARQMAVQFGFAQMIDVSNDRFADYLGTL